VRALVLVALLASAGTGAALALLAAAPARAQEPCRSGDAAREGVLVSLRHQHPNGTWFRAFVLRLPKPACVLDDEGARHEQQSEIGLFPQDERQLARYVGRKVRIEGEGPIVGETAWHVRDLTIMGAKVIHGEGAPTKH
jgi:hypothetical protein